MISGLAFTTVVADSGHVLQGFGHIIRVKGNFGAWFLVPLQKFCFIWFCGWFDWLFGGWLVSPWQVDCRITDEMIKLS